MGKLDGQVAFITGGARGQGRSHALALAGEGADVAICDIAAQLETVPYPLASEDDLAETVRQVEALGRRCVAVKADVRSTEQVEGAVEEALAELGRIDILLANAGVCGFGAFWEISDQMWDEMVDTDLTGVFKSMRAVVPHMIDRGYGRIVATSSMGGRMGNPNLAHYVAAKWGVIGLVKTLALEVADKGITVNAVCPATVDTEMVHNDALYGLFAPDIENPTKEQVEPRYTAMNPIPVPWTPAEEISAAVMYLVSPEARLVTGTTLDVCMGASARMP
ncbi:MAG TPA: mycofactocin-coupled SDR family oxidoreductase [Solirubrobacterales bacterium]|nr:mycofactocin-coupled SDR family oxidoreductase [Solirubrobacterales bacterium]